MPRSNTISQHTTNDLTQKGARDGAQDGAKNQAQDQAKDRAKDLACLEEFLRHSEIFYISAISLLQL